jgi:hypothetical protein
MISRFLKKMCCCFYLDPDDTDDVYNALHNDECVRVTDKQIRGPSVNSYSLSDDAMPTYDQIYR